MPNPTDDPTRPYTIDDLSHAVAEYNHTQKQHTDALKMVAAKRSEMDSFQKEADKLVEELERRKARVRKVAGNLEKI